MALTAISKELTEPFLEQGIQDTNFFNGRLLTAGDLVNLQEASRRRDYQLGLGVGAGVVEGLEVRLLNDGSDGKPPTLAVSQGLAFNRLGKAVALAQNVEVRLAKEQPAVSPNGKSPFEVCLPPQQNGKPLPGKGAYVFLARPASGLRGQAPRRGFGQDARVEGCDRDLILEGVQFRLVSMDVSTLENLQQATRDDLALLLQDTDNSGTVGLQAQNKLRNWLAHLCLGSEELAAWQRDPLARVADDFFGAAVRSPFDSYGAVDALRDKGLLDDCDVPLALICWTQTGVKWADMWSVRRRLAGCEAPSRPWPLPLAERQQREAEAAFQQFQDHLGSLLLKLAPTTLIGLHATDYFRYLPAAGILPIARGAFRGFDLATFFDPPHRDTEYIDGQALRALMAESQGFGAIDLQADELIWLYQPWQNAKAIDDGENIQPTIVFTTGHMPHRALARLDVARWNYSQYADAGAGIRLDVSLG